MARFNYSGVAITGGTGRLNSSLGGSVLMKNGVVRNYVTPTNPQSAAQSIVRNAFAFLNGAWAGISEADKLAWEDARLLPYYVISDPFTGTSRAANSAKALFIELNFNLLQATGALGVPAVVLALPEPPEADDNLGSFTLTTDVANETMSLAYLGGTPSDVKIAFRATPPVSPGNMKMTSVRSQLRSIGVYGTATPIDVKATYIAVHTNPFQVGQKIFFIIESINSNTGKKRSITTSYSVVIPGV